MSGQSTRTIISLAIASALSSTAYAQGLEEIIVTAQKREQSAMEVPLSVTTVDAELMQSIFDGGSDVRALSARVPGLYIESSNGRVAPRFYIRGLGNTDFDLAASQPVSVIMDDVVMENVILKSFPIFDVENVEVLRGPQGTLFGRNTTAGIVKFQSAKPSQELDGYATISAAQLGSYNFEGAVGAGITDDLAFRVSLLNQHRDDWISNGYTGDSEVMGGFDELAARVQLLWTPSDRLEVLANVHARDLDGTAAMFRANIFNKGSNELSGSFDRDTVSYDSPYNNPQSYKSNGASLNVSYALDSVEFTSITAIENAEGSSLGDIDGGYGCAFCGTPTGPGFIPFDSTTSDKLDDLTQFTQEFRVAGDASDTIRWQAGVYYFDSGFNVTTNPFFAPATKVRHENTLSAVFGHVEIDLSEVLRLTIGGRYTSDEKRFFGPDIRDEASDKKFSGDVAVNYDLNDDMVIYGRIANGFRGPSIQGRDMAFSGTYSIADSETVTSYEIGYKAELADRVRLNAAIFTYTVEDMQFTAVGGDGNSIRLLNADEGNVVGAEIDTTILITDNLVATAGFAYNDTEINDNDLLVSPCGNFGSFLCTVTDPVVNGFAAIDGNPFPNAPETTFNFTLSYTMPLAGGNELFAFTDWAYQGATNIFLYESTEFQTDGQFEGGLRAGYRAGDTWEVALFGRNITDEKNVQGAIDFNNLTGFVNEPSIFGIEASYNL
jgi:iron complex outermembrane receptor protein